MFRFFLLTSGPGKPCKPGEPGSPSSPFRPNWPGLPWGPGGPGNPGNLEVSSPMQLQSPRSPAGFRGERRMDEERRRKESFKNDFFKLNYTCFG